MKKILIYSLMLTAIALCIVSCTKNPIDEDGLLITTRQECRVTSFDLLDSNHNSVAASTPVVDSTYENATITIVCRPGTNLKAVWPRFSLAEDCKLDPKVVAWNDFTDPNTLTKYTVISGDRKKRVKYTINVSVLPAL